MVLMTFLVSVLVSALLQIATATPTRMDPAIVEGTIVRLGTDAPVDGAIVELSSASDATIAPSTLTVTADKDGKFKLEGIRPGPYRLVATHPNGSYFPAEYLQKNSRRRGEIFTLAPGQVLRGVRLEME